jgi:D-xylose transport system substrate-binding protein
MRKGLFALAAVGLLATGSVAACGDSKGSDSGSTSGSSAKGKVGVILPDTKSSQRWGTDDPKFLKAAFDAAGVQADIQNAQGDKTAFQTIADGMISSGVKVLIIVNLDSGTGKAVLDKAKAAGIATIDYDRLTLNGGANYYVSFDNVKVGELQGQGLEQCLAADKETSNAGVVYINGAATDNNAALFKQGYDTYLKTQQSAGKVKILSSNISGNWDTTAAGKAFDGLYSQFGSQIKGVISANDTMATGVIASLKRNHLNGKIPVTGQDASIAGLQQILAGDQCMTVYKNVALEAGAVSKLAIDLAKNDTASADALATTTVDDTVLNTKVKSVLETPEIITAANVEKVVTDGYQKASDICTSEFTAACAKYGVK